MSEKSIRIQARYIVVSPDRILHPGQVVVNSHRILELANNTREQADVVLEDTAILPGLINAHTHLELSDCSEPISASGSFPDWVSQVIRHRMSRNASLDESQKKEKLSATLAQGWGEASSTGTAYLADIVGQPWQPERLRRASQLLGTPQAQVLALPELIGLSAERWDDNSQWAESVLDNLANPKSAGMTVGVSPHAPYSLRWSELEAFFSRRGEPSLTSMHVAESEEELEWLATGTGEFAACYERLGLPMDLPRPSIQDAIQFLQRRRKALLIHGNYLTEQQMATIGTTPNVSVVYCPRTHQHFGHSAYPWSQLKSKAVRVIFGTDSRASSPDLDLWREVIAARRDHRDMKPEDALDAVTRQAAVSLGIEQDWGDLELGKRSWLNHVSVPAQWNARDLLEHLTCNEIRMRPLHFSNHPKG